MTFNTCVARFNRMCFNIPYNMPAFSTAVDLSSYDIESVNIRENIQNCYPTINATIDGIFEIETDPYVYAYYSDTDHLGVSQTLFAGILPVSNISIDKRANKTKITGYGMGYYLSQSLVPTDLLHNTAGTNPAIVLYHMLGGDAWAEQTGIEPYILVPDTAWGDTLSSRVFDFDRKTFRINAIKKYLDYCRYYLHIGIRTVSSIPQPCAYYVPEASLDTYLNLPAQLTVTNNSASLLESVPKVETKSDRRYNKVTVQGRAPTGSVYSASLATDGYINGTDIPKEYYESSGAWTTQAQVNARVLDLYTYYCTDAITVSGKFTKRLDLRLLQKLVFSGYTGVPTDTMRIVDISYDISKKGKVVSFQATSDAAFRNTRLMYRSMNADPVSEIEGIFDGKASQMPYNQVGTVTAVDETASTATVLLEDGTEIEARIIS